MEPLVSKYSMLALDQDLTNPCFAYNLFLICSMMFFFGCFGLLPKPILHVFPRNYDGDVKELSLVFTVTAESFGKIHVIELKPGGRDTSVTSDNKLQYIHAIADYKLNRRVNFRSRIL
ncbi:E3 ubiquitin-protein ligase upl7 [Dionaea muscipula]